MPRQSERVGRSGEYLVASVLSTLSDTVTVMPHGVKTQKQIEKARKSWRFDLRCGSHSKNRFYNKGDIDVYALVALNCQKVMFFFPDGRKQVSVEDKDIQAIDSLKNVENLFKELQCQQTP
jgi:ribosomal protein L32E